MRQAPNHVANASQTQAKRGRLVAVALVPILLAAWQIVPLVLSPWSLWPPVVVLLATASVASGGGVLGVVLITSSRGETPTTQRPQVRERGGSRVVAVLRGWAVFLLLSAPTALLAIATTVSNGPLLAIAIALQVVLIVGAQVIFVLVVVRRG